MQEKRDLRVQKTYEGLINAFQELLKEKTFEEITVKELCACAKTRTATFYSHFSDKYDFFAFMVKELRKSFSDNVEVTYSKSEPTDYYTTLMKNGLEYLEMHDKMANTIKSNNMLVGMLQFMPDEMTNELKKHLSADLPEYSQLKHPDLVIQFLLGGMNQVTEWWFVNRKSISKEEVVKDIDIILNKLLLS